jgi:hypothetical protein
MQTHIARAVGFVISGNARLAGISGWEPDQKLFSFCEFVRFTELEKTQTGWHERPFATDFADWIEKLQRSGVNQLRMRNVTQDKPLISDRMSVGFVGGGPRWLIEAISRDGSAVWEGREELGNRDDPEKKIWRVTYGRVAKQLRTELLPGPDLDDMTHRFREVLTDARSFSEAQTYMGAFAAYFTKALSALDGAVDPAPYFSLAPRGFLPAQAERLLTAAQFAWVFGGMGSWNDVGFKNPEEMARYEQISTRLFSTSKEALAAAANSSMRFAEAKPKRPRWRLW